jgi:hypothetical protein
MAKYEKHVLIRINYTQGEFGFMVMPVKKKLFSFLAVAAVVAASLAPLNAHALTSSTGVTLPAGVQQVNSATFVQTVNPCSCSVTIDGYSFIGMPYYDGTTKSAVGLWFELLSQPGYVSYPPIKSVSTTTTVSGTVGSSSRP